MRIKIMLCGIICLSYIGCNRYEDIDIIGLWQSLNETTVIEFTTDYIDLYRNGEPFWSLAAVNRKLNYNLMKLQKGWYQLDIMDGQERFIKCKIEIVNKDRIRIYYFKHHDILDHADEYHRTNDFNSFNTIMKKIVNKPEPKS